MNSLSQSPVPRYIQLATLFKRRIDSGQWKVGEQIPTVDELVEQCGVARATIRQALGVLESERIIERFRAKGTFVRRQAREDIWCNIESSFAGQLRTRADAEIKVLTSMAGQTPPVAPHAGGELVPSYRYFRRMHSFHGQPYMIGDVYLDERLMPLIPEDWMHHQTSLKMVNDFHPVPIVDSHQTMTIGAADIETAELLQVPLNAPIALVERTAQDRDGFLIMVAYAIYRGDVVRMDIKLR